MKITKPLPPEDIKIRVSGEIAEGLRLYHLYLAEAASIKERWKFEEMCAGILGTFLVEGDAEFVAWRKRHNPKAIRFSATPVEANGATDG